MLQSERKFQVLLMSVAVLALLTYLVLFIEKETAVHLTAEDGLVESIGAISFLIAGFLFAIIYFKSKTGNDFFVFKTKRNLFFLILSLAFIFAGGEEISWGQRLIGFETPEQYKALNLQSETNLHNFFVFHPRNADGETKTGLLRMVTFERIFGLFWLSFCVMVPVAFNFNQTASRFIRKINVPIVPLYLGIFFLLTYALSKIIESYFLANHKDLIWPLTETKETTFAILFMVVSLYFYCFNKRAKRE